MNAFYASIGAQLQGVKWSVFIEKNGIENNTVIKVGFTLTFDFKTGPCLYKTYNMPKKQCHGGWVD